MKSLCIFVFFFGSWEMVLVGTRFLYLGDILFVVGRSRWVGGRFLIGRGLYDGIDVFVRLRVGIFSIFLKRKERIEIRCEVRDLIFR